MSMFQLYAELGGEEFPPPKRPPPPRDEEDGAADGPKIPFFQYTDQAEEMTRRQMGVVRSPYEGATCVNENDPGAILFDQFCSANTFQGIMSTFQQLCDLVEEKPRDHEVFYHQLRGKLKSWKAQSLWNKLDKRSTNREYKGAGACNNTRVLIIGGGPCGLRVGIEVALMGGKAVVVEKRDRFSRNNVLHLWPFLIHDLKALGAKKFFGKFCAGSIDHISIRALQCILVKVALLVGVEIHSGVSFEELLEPTASTDDSEAHGWKAKVLPEDSPVSEYEFDVLVGADGKRNTLSGFRRKEFRGKLAIAITANFINRNTQAEASVEEISGVAYIFNQKFFKDLNSQTGIDLENIVYYKDDTHYFVMTAKKHSLLLKGVLIQDFEDPARLLAKENVDQQKLLDYAIEAADVSTRHKLPNLEFAHNHYGQPDVAMFDFTSMFAAEHASRVVERKGKKLLVSLVGDSLIEPFWPTGSGCARGFLGALDAAWMIRSWASAKMTPLEVMAERESIYQLLSQTTPENVNKNFSLYTIDPNTRYPNLNPVFFKPHQVMSQYDGVDKAYLNEIVQLAEQRSNRYEMIRDSHNLLKWFQKQLESYRHLAKVMDLTASWTSGMALCSLIHKYRPELVDVYTLDTCSCAENCQLAFDIAEREFGIQAVTTGMAMARGEVPDKLSFVSYLSQFYEYFRKESIRPAKIARPPQQFRVRTKPRSPASKLSMLNKLGSRIRQRRPIPSDSDSQEEFEKDNDSDTLKRYRQPPVATGMARKRIKDMEQTGSQEEEESKLLKVRREIKAAKAGVKGQNKVSALAKDLSKKFSGKSTPPESKKVTTRPLIQKPASDSDECYFCKKTVYLVERYTAEGLFFHRGCFRCDYCNSSLRIGGYAFLRTPAGEAKFYCHQHYGMKRPFRKSRKRSFGDKENQNPPSGDLKGDRTPPRVRATAGLSQVDSAAAYRTPERIEYVTESEVEESELEQTKHNLSVSLLDDDNSLSESSSDDMVFEDEEEEDMSEEELSIVELAKSYSKKLRKSYEKQVRKSRGKGGDDDSDTGTETATIGASDADWESGSDTEKESDSESIYGHMVRHRRSSGQSQQELSGLDRSKESSNESNREKLLLSPTALKPFGYTSIYQAQQPQKQQAPKEPKPSPASASSLKNRMSFFSNVSEPVRIDAMSFLGLRTPVALPEPEPPVPDPEEPAENLEEDLDVTPKASDNEIKEKQRSKPQKTKKKRRHKRGDKRRLTGEVEGSMLPGMQEAAQVITVGSDSSDEEDDDDVTDKEGHSGGPGTGEEDGSLQVVEGMDESDATISDTDKQVDNIEDEMAELEADLLAFDEGNLPFSEGKIEDKDQILEDYQDISEGAAEQSTVDRKSESPSIELSSREDTEAKGRKGSGEFTVSVNQPSLSEEIGCEKVSHTDKANVKSKDDSDIKNEEQQLASNVEVKKDPSETPSKPEAQPTTEVPSSASVVQKVDDTPSEKQTPAATSPTQPRTDSPARGSRVLRQRRTTTPRKPLFPAPEPPREPSPPKEIEKEPEPVPKPARPEVLQPAGDQPKVWEPGQKAPDSNPEAAVKADVKTPEDAPDGSPSTDSSEKNTNSNAVTSSSSTDVSPTGNCDPIKKPTSIYLSDNNSDKPFVPKVSVQSLSSVDRSSLDDDYLEQSIDISPDDKRRGKMLASEEEITDEDFDRATADESEKESNLPVFQPSIPEEPHERGSESSGSDVVMETELVSAADTVVSCVPTLELSEAEAGESELATAPTAVTSSSSEDVSASSKDALEPLPQDSASDQAESNRVEECMAVDSQDIPQNQEEIVKVELENSTLAEVNASHDSAVPGESMMDTAFVDNSSDKMDTSEGPDLANLTELAQENMANTSLLPDMSVLIKENNQGASVDDTMMVVESNITPTVTESVQSAPPESSSVTEQVPVESVPQSYESPVAENMNVCASTAEMTGMDTKDIPKDNVETVTTSGVTQTVIETESVAKDNLVDCVRDDVSDSCVEAVVGDSKSVEDNSDNKNIVCEGDVEEKMDCIVQETVEKDAVMENVTDAERDTANSEKMNVVPVKSPVYADENKTDDVAMETVTNTSPTEDTSHTASVSMESTKTSLSQEVKAKSVDTIDDKESIDAVDKFVEDVLSGDIRNIASDAKSEVEEDSRSDLTLLVQDNLADTSTIGDLSTMVEVNRPHLDVNDSVFVHEAKDSTKQSEPSGTEEKVVRSDDTKSKTVEKLAEESKTITESDSVPEFSPIRPVSETVVKSTNEQTVSSSPSSIEKARKEQELIIKLEQKTFAPDIFESMDKVEDLDQTHSDIKTKFTPADRRPTSNLQRSSSGPVCKPSAEIKTSTPKGNLERSTSLDAPDDLRRKCMSKEDLQADAIKRIDELLFSLDDSKEKDFDVMSDRTDSRMETEEEDDYKEEYDSSQIVAFTVDDELGYEKSFKVNEKYVNSRNRKRQKTGDSDKSSKSVSSTSTISLTSDSVKTASSPSDLRSTKATMKETDSKGRKKEAFSPKTSPLEESISLERLVEINMNSDDMLDDLEIDAANLTINTTKQSSKTNKTVQPSSPNFSQKTVLSNGTLDTLMSPENTTPFLSANSTAAVVDDNDSSYYTPTATASKHLIPDTNENKISPNSSPLTQRIDQLDTKTILSDTISETSDQKSLHSNASQISSSSSPYSPHLVKEAKWRFFSEAAQPVRIDPRSMFPDIPNKNNKKLNNISDRNGSVLASNMKNLELNSEWRGLDSGTPTSPTAGVPHKDAASGEHDVFYTPATSMKQPHVENGRHDGDYRKAAEVKKRLLPTTPAARQGVTASEIKMAKEQEIELSRAAARERARLKSDEELGISSSKGFKSRPESASTSKQAPNIPAGQKRPMSAAAVVAPGGKSDSSTLSSTDSPQRPQSDSTSDHSGNSPHTGRKGKKDKNKGKKSKEDKENRDASEGKKEKRRSFLSLLMPSRSTEKKDKAKSPPVDSRTSASSPPLLQAKDRPMSAQEKKKSLERQQPPVTSSGVKLRNKGGVNRIQEEEEKLAEQRRSVYDEFAPLMDDLSEASKKNKENLQERLEQVAPPPAKAPNTSLRPPRATMDEFDTESEAGDDKMSVRSFQAMSQSLTEEELSRMLKRQHKAVAKRQKEQERKRLRTAQEIQRQLEELEIQQRRIEDRGVSVERALRGEGKDAEKDESELMQDWFNIVHEKNMLVRRESELMVQARELELEDRQSRLEQQLRELMTLTDAEKTEEKQEEEKRVLQELLEVVEQRDALVALLEEDRLKPEPPKAKDFNLP